MKNDPDGNGSAKDTLREAHALYRQMIGVVAKALEAPVEEGRPPKELVLTFKELVAALHKLIEIEVGLEERSGKRRSSLSGSSFDLDAAREEIRERLSRLHSVRKD